MEERTGIVTPERTIETVDAEFQAAVAAKDYAAIRKLSNELQKMQSEAEISKREEALKGRAELTEKVKAKFDAFVQKMVDSKVLDGCDGIWFSYDFGSTETALRLFKDEKKARKSSGSGSGGTGKHFAVTTKELLEKHGDEQVGENAGKDFRYTVAGADIAWTAETTWTQMAELSKNGNWQYFKVRMPLLKLEGLL